MKNPLSGISASLSRQTVSVNQDLNDEIIQKINGVSKLLLDHVRMELMDGDTSKAAISSGLDVVKTLGGIYIRDKGSIKTETSNISMIAELTNLMQELDPQFGIETPKSIDSTTNIAIEATSEDIDEYEEDDEYEDF